MGCQTSTQSINRSIRTMPRSAFPCDKNSRFCFPCDKNLKFCFPYKRKNCQNSVFFVVSLLHKPIKGCKYASCVKISMSNKKTLPNSVFSMVSLLYFALKHLKYATIFFRILCVSSLNFPRICKIFFITPICD